VKKGVGHLFDKCRRDSTFAAQIDDTCDAAHKEKGLYAMESAARNWFCEVKFEEGRVLSTVFEPVLRQSLPENHRIFGPVPTSGGMPFIDNKGREGLPYTP
jgi:hypothetical protein